MAAIQHGTLVWPADKPKLSELMLKGVKETKKITGDYCYHLGDDKWGTCAIGAAAWACDPERVKETAGATTIIARCVGLQTAWFDLTEVKYPPGSGLREGKTDTVWEVIIYLNDDAKWSRTRIAAWLKSEGL